MCLAMNPDKLVGREVCASSSNRNFKGRQGSPTGRTLLMSPAMVAAAAVAGEVADVRALLPEEKRERSAIDRIAGRALPLRGDDIDTDRIIPARFLVSVTFDGLGEHVFEDDRAARRRTARPIPSTSPRFAGASILLVNRNFGCGSSREHAPQALQRWGIRAIVGESFAEIFFGNSLALGLPCVIAAPDAIRALQEAVLRDPGLRVEVDLESRTVRAGTISAPITLPDSAREAFLSGGWDATGLLLERFEEVEAVAEKLPYVSGFRRGRLGS